MTIKRINKKLHLQKALKQTQSIEKTLDKQQKNLDVLKARSYKSTLINTERFI